MSRAYTHATNEVALARDNVIEWQHTGDAASVSGIAAMQFVWRRPPPSNAPTRLVEAVVMTKPRAAVPRGVLLFWRAKPPTNSDKLLRRPAWRGRASDRAPHENRRCLQGGLGCASRPEFTWYSPPSTNSARARLLPGRRSPSGPTWPSRSATLTRIPETEAGRIRIEIDGGIDDRVAEKAHHIDAVLTRRAPRQIVIRPLRDTARSRTIGKGPRRSQAGQQGDGGRRPG